MKGTRQDGSTWPIWFFPACQPNRFIYRCQRTSSPAVRYEPPAALGLEKQSSAVPMITQTVLLKRVFLFRTCTLDFSFFLTIKTLVKWVMDLAEAEKGKKTSKRTWILLFFVASCWHPSTLIPAVITISDINLWWFKSPGFPFSSVNFYLQIEEIQRIDWDRVSSKQRFRLLRSIAGRQLWIENAFFLFYAAKGMLTQQASASDLIHVSELFRCGNDKESWLAF